MERRFIRPVRGRQNWLTQALRWAAAPSWRRMAETNHDGCEQECGCWEEGFADALAGMQEWSITVHDGTCRCEFCVTGIALIEAALGDMAGILREIRGELKPAEPSDELTDPRTRRRGSPPSGGVHQQRRWSWSSGREGTPGRRAESLEQLPRHAPRCHGTGSSEAAAKPEPKCPVLLGDFPMVSPLFYNNPPTSAPTGIAGCLPTELSGGCS